MKLNFRKIFNWDISNVADPVPVYDNELFRGNQLSGYKVVVTYKYHGKQNVFFDIDSEQLWIMYEHPLRAARIFVNKMRNKQALQQQKQNGICQR